VTHDLKCVEPYFQHVLDGDKTFELRNNDRGFQKGDVLHLLETRSGRYETGREMWLRVTYVLGGPWMAHGNVALGFHRMDPPMAERQ
jgi:hypothetical protein